MIEYIDNLLLSYGMLAIFILMAFNGLVSAPPSELILALAGAWAASIDIDLPLVIAIAVTGNITGAIILYLMGRHWGVDWLAKKKNKLLVSQKPIIRKISQFIPESDRLHQYSALFIKSGWVWVGLLRCFPVVRSIVSFPAGMALMPFITFLAISISGMAVWAISWVSVGVMFNHSWVEYKGSVSIVLLVTLMIFLMAFYLILKRTSMNILNTKIPNKKIDKDATR